MEWPFYVVGIGFITLAAVVGPTTRQTRPPAVTPPVVIAADCSAEQAFATRLAFKSQIEIDGEVREIGRLIDQMTPDDGVLWDDRTESWVVLPPRFSTKELWAWTDDTAMPRFIIVDGVMTQQSQKEVQSDLDATRDEAPSGHHQPYRLQNGLL